MQIYKFNSFTGYTRKPVETYEAVQSSMRPSLVGDEGSRETERAEFDALREFVGKLAVLLIDKDLLDKDEVNTLLNHGYTTEE